MKLSLKWLKDYVAPGVTAEKLAYKLTMAGMEVEKISSEAGDTVFELEITPNRPDCLNVIGLARETAAIMNKPLKLPKTKLPSFPRKACDITIEDAEGCPRYIGTLIEDVKVSPVTAEMKQRLTAIGLRMINNVVDITNFCLQETGQPMHAFDYDKLKGGKIIVRRAKKDEKIVTIDGEERELDPSILVIADAERPVAIAGVMGGLETEVSNKTTRILLESAYFDPVLIRRAARELGLSSDSSYRFERGVDVPTVESGADRAIALILEMAGGKMTARKDVFPGKKKKAAKPIVVTFNDINELLGARIPKAQCQSILKKLNFKVFLEGQRLRVTPPSNRNDVKQKEDIIEEIGRVIGYDNLPLSLPQVKMTNISIRSRRPIKKRLREGLIGQGLSEIITYALVSQSALERSRQQDLNGIKLQNCLTQEHAIMRPTLLPSHLNVVRDNINRGQKDLKFFEIGKIYPPKGEQEVLAIVLTGQQQDDWRMMQKRLVDFFDLKGVIEQSGCHVNAGMIAIEPQEDSVFVPGQGAIVAQADKKIGRMGQIAEDILKEWDIKFTQVFFAELNIEGWLSREQKIHAYQSPSEYPTVSRDISLAVPKTVRFHDIEKYVQEQGKGILTEIRFLEQYCGEKIATDQRGLIFSLTYQSLKRTLTEDEVQKVHDEIIQGLTQQFSAKIR